MDPTHFTKRQLIVINRLVRVGSGCVWWRVGTGKTRIALGYFATIAKGLAEPGLSPFPPQFLVVCRREAFFDWDNEIKKLSLPFISRELECESDLYRNQSRRKAMVFLLSHGKLKKLQPSINHYASKLQACAFDEGFLYKNPGTLHCKAANSVSEQIGRSIILSGSVMTARDLTDIYGQLYAINKHNELAINLTSYRTKYMRRFDVNFGQDRKAIKWCAPRGSVTRITERLRRSEIASFYFPDNNQRRIVHDVKTIPATPDQLRHFKDLREFYELNIGEQSIEYNNAPSIITKCQQISDGFVKVENEYLTVASSKLDYLMYQLQQLTSSGEKVVVWTAFRHSVDLILQRLQKSMKFVKAYGMHGSLKLDQHGWNTQGQVAVATVASGSSINHFRNCVYAIYYSHSFHWLHMQQSRGRTNRKDSLHKTCFYYYLQTRDSLDPFVYKIVNSSSKAEENIIQQGVNSWLKNV